MLLLRLWSHFKELAPFVKGGQRAALGEFVRVKAAQMAGAREPPDLHAGGARGMDAGHGVLDHEAVARIDAHGIGGKKEQIRRGLAVGNLRSREQAVAEVRREAGQFKRPARPLRARTGRHAERHADIAEDVPDTGHGAQFGLEGGQKVAAVAVLEVGIEIEAVGDAHFGGDLRPGTAEEVFLHIGEIDMHADAAELFDQDARADDLAVDEHAHRSRR